MTVAIWSRPVFTGSFQLRRYAIRLCDIPRAYSPPIF